MAKNASKITVNDQNHLKITINTGHSGYCGKVSTKKKKKILILPEMVNHIKLLNNIELKKQYKDGQQYKAKSTI